MRREEIELIWDAFLYASDKHSGQLDRAGKPYILHPVTVAVFTSELTSDPEIIAAALLHDTVEDTDATTEEIAGRFGLRVAEIVESMTKRDGEDYYHYVRRAARNRSAIPVKRSDLRHNMDLSRLISVAEEDYIRLDKYRKALQILDDLEHPDSEE